MADVRVEVTGLDRAKENFKKLDGDMKTEIGRAALREQALRVLRSIKAATYTTFIRRSGFIKKGFGVRVGKQLNADEHLNAVIVEYPQSAIGGGEEPARFRASAFRKGKWAKNPDKKAIAFWWRFLEFGTADRKNVRKPKGARISKRTGKLNRRSQRALDRFNAAHSLGRIAARPWVRPAFSASVHSSIDRFTAVIRKKTEETVSNYPK
jgi:hypothetical protein